MCSSPFQGKMIDKTPDIVLSPSGKKLDALTSLRFFAVAMIVVYHCQWEFGQTINIDNYFTLNQAVSFFFVLSGFILAYVYPVLNIKDIGRFYLARFARIWPLHAATLILALLFIPLRPTLRESFPWVILTNLTMVHAYVPLWDYFLSFNSVSWAISTEFFFYLCFPFLIYRWRQTWTWKLILSFILLLAMIIICNVWHLPAQNWVSGISLPGLVYVGPLARMIEFVLGMIIASGWRAKGQYLNLSRATGTIVELTAMILTVASIHYTTVIPHWPALRMYCGDAFSYWISSSGSAPLFGILIFVLSLEKGMISKILSLPAAVVLGEISYSIYLVHQVLLRFYQNNRLVFSDIPAWVAYVLYWIIVLVVSHLMWKFIEQPCRQLINGLPSKIKGGTDKPSQNRPGQGGGTVRFRELFTEAGLKTRWMVVGEVLFLVLVSIAVLHRVPQPFYLFQHGVTQVVPEEGKDRPGFPPSSLSSSLPEVLSGLTLAPGGNCNLEMINNVMIAKGAVISKKEKVTLVGWAADVQSGSVPATVIVQFSTADGNHDFYGTALRLTKRPDVSRAFHNPLFENAGYDLSADIGAMPAGQYTIKIIQVAEKKAIVCHTKKELTVSQFQ